MCPVLSKLRVNGVCRDRAQARGASRPASKFVDGSPSLAARVLEVNGIDDFTTVSSALAEKIGMKRLYQSYSPQERRWNDRGSRTLWPSMAHSSCDGHVGYIVWLQISGSRKNFDMPS